MSDWPWDWITTIAMLIVTYLLCKKWHHAPLVGAVAQIFWVIYALVNEQYAFIVAAAVFAWVYLKAQREWNAERKYNKP